MERISIDSKNYFGEFHNLDKFMDEDIGFEKEWGWPGSFSRGFFYLIKLKSGLILTVMEHSSDKPLLINFEDNANRFILSFILTPETNNSYPINIHTNSSQIALEPSYSYLTYTPNSYGELKLPAFFSFCSVGILVQPWLMKDLCVEFWDNLSDEFKRALKPSREKIDFHRTLSITPLINMKLHEILGCCYQGSMKKYFFESKVLEILLMAIEQLINPFEANYAFRSIFPECPEFIDDARNILLENMADPPSLLELSKLVGVNKTTLNKSFRRFYGSSIFEYLRICRLEKSKLLLQRGRKNVTEVAFEVGYSQQSSFTTEFKKYFGKNPRNYLE